MKARTPQELVPLIRKKLDEAEGIEGEISELNVVKQMRQAAEKCRAEAGLMMLEAKPQLKGEFQKWINKNFQPITYRTATNYMRLAESLKVKRVSPLAGVRELPPRQKQDVGKRATPATTPAKKDIAKMLGVSEMLVDRATAIRNASPELADKLRQGTKTIRQAERELRGIDGGWSPATVSTADVPAGDFYGKNGLLAQHHHRVMDKILDTFYQCLEKPWPEIVFKDEVEAKAFVAERVSEMCDEIDPIVSEALAKAAQLVIHEITDGEKGEDLND